VRVTVTPDQIQSAFDTFKGIRRRMEIRGIAGGVTVVDDFGHHPTAIRETLRALRVRYTGQHIHAIFEPRSNTTRRNVFQQELVSAFADADFVVVSQVDRLEQLSPSERLDPGRLMDDLKIAGKPAAYLPNVDAISAVEHDEYVSRPIDHGNTIVKRDRHQRRDASKRNDHPGARAAIDHNRRADPQCR